MSDASGGGGYGKAPRPAPKAAPKPGGGVFGFIAPAAKTARQGDQVASATKTLRQLMRPPAPTPVRPVDDQVHATGKVQAGRLAQPAKPRPISFIDKLSPSGKRFTADKGPGEVLSAQIASAALATLRGTTLADRARGATALENLGIAPTSRLTPARIIGQYEAGQTIRGMRGGKAALTDKSVLNHIIDDALQGVSKVPLIGKPVAGVGKFVDTEIQNDLLQGKGPGSRALGSAARWTGNAINDVSRFVESHDPLYKSSLAARNLGGRIDPTTIVGNAASDAVNLPAQILPSFYEPIAGAVEYAEGRPKRLNEVLKGFEGMATGKFLQEHPLDAFLMARGAGVGVAGLAGRVGFRGVAPKAGVRAPESLYGNLKEPKLPVSENPAMAIEQQLREASNSAIGRNGPIGRMAISHGIERRVDEEAAAQQHDLKNTRARVIHSHLQSLGAKISPKQMLKTLAHPASTVDEHGARAPVFGHETLPGIVAALGGRDPATVLAHSQKLLALWRGEAAKDTTLPADHEVVQARAHNIAMLQKAINDPKALEKMTNVIRAGHDYAQELGTEGRLSHELADKSLLARQTVRESPATIAGQFHYGAGFDETPRPTAAYENEKRLLAEKKRAEANHNAVVRGTKRSPSLRLAQREITAAAAEHARLKNQEVSLAARAGVREGKARVLGKEGGESVKPVRTMAALEAARGKRLEVEQALKRNAQRMVTARKSARIQRRADEDHAAASRDAAAQAHHEAKVPTADRTEIRGLVHTPESLAAVEDHLIRHPGDMNIPKPGAKFHAADVYKMMLGQGLALPGHVSGQALPGEDLAPQMYGRPDRAPKPVASRAQLRTGKAFLRGQIDLSADSLLRERMRNELKLVQHRSTGSALAKFGTITHDAHGQERYIQTPDEGARLAKNPDYRESQGLPRDPKHVKLVVVRVGPQFVKNVHRAGLRATIEEERNGALPESLGGQVVANPEGNHDPGYYMLLPEREVVQRFDSHQNIASGYKGMRFLSNQMRTVRYTLSTKHLLGVASETLYRNFAEGAGPLSYMVGRAYLRSVTDPAVLREIENRLLTGTGTGQALHQGRYRTTPTPGSFADLRESIAAPGRHIPVAGAAPRIWRAYAHAALSSTKRLVETTSQTAQVGKLLIRDAKAAEGPRLVHATTSLRLKAVFDAGAEAMAHQDKVLTDLAANRRDPASIVELARRLDKVAGKWDRLSPNETRMVTVSPFASWFVNSLRWLYAHVPTSHPIEAGLLGALNVGTQPQREKQGEGTISQKHGLVGFEQGGIVTSHLLGINLGGKKVIGQQYYSPFGAVSDPIHTALDLASPPFLNDIARAAVGVSSLNGATLRDKAGNPLLENPLELAGYVANLALGDMVPLYTLAQQMAQGGRSANPASVPWAEQTYGTGGSALTGVLKTLRPIRISKEQRRKPRTGGAHLGNLGLGSSSGSKAKGGYIGGSNGGAGGGYFTP